MDDDIKINWFPGHMAKAHRTIQGHLKMVDVVIELLDARIPLSSANPLIQQNLATKNRIIVLNKADLAEPAGTDNWLAYFKTKGTPAIAIDTTTGKNVKNLVNTVIRLAGEKIHKLQAKGIKNRNIRAMIVGIPNVGKSSLINRLLGANIAKTADKPGVTRGKQWINVGNKLDLLDTPGVLWPKIEQPEVGFMLAITGSISDDIYDLDRVIIKFIDFLLTNYPERLVTRYNLIRPLPENWQAVLSSIGSKRGCLRSGGVVDTDKAGKIVLTEFRTGKLGPFTLEKPPAEN